jgi:hypothetical protein
MKNTSVYFRSNEPLHKPLENFLPNKILYRPSTCRYKTKAHIYYEDMSSNKKNYRV